MTTHEKHSISVILDTIHSNDLKIKENQVVKKIACYMCLMYNEYTKCFNERHWYAVSTVTPYFDICQTITKGT